VIAGAQAAAAEALAPLQDAMIAITWERTKRTAAVRRLNELEAIEASAEVATAWSAQYNDEIPAGDVPATPTGAEDNAVTVATASGRAVITSITSANPCAHDARALPADVLFVDAALAPGVETWRPTWRTGTVVEIYDSGAPGDWPDPEKPLRVRVDPAILPGTLGTYVSRRNINCTPPGAFFDADGVLDARLGIARQAYDDAIEARDEILAEIEACKATYTVETCTAPLNDTCAVNRDAQLIECAAIRDACLAAAEDGNAVQYCEDQYASCVAQVEALFSACIDGAMDACIDAKSAHDAQCEQEARYDLTQAETAVSAALRNLQNASADIQGPPAELILDLPIAHCKSSVYEVGDDVLIDFPARGASSGVDWATASSEEIRAAAMAVWQSAQVVGWASETKECSIPAFQARGDYYRWDVSRLPRTVYSDQEVVDEYLSQSPIMHESDYGDISWGATTVTIGEHTIRSGVADGVILAACLAFVEEDDEENPAGVYIRMLIRKGTATAGTTHIYDRRLAFCAQVIERASSTVPTLDGFVPVEYSYTFSRDGSRVLCYTHLYYFFMLDSRLGSAGGQIPGGTAEGIVWEWVITSDWAVIYNHRRPMLHLPDGERTYLDDVDECFITARYKGTTASVITTFRGPEMDFPLNAYHPVEIRENGVAVVERVSFMTIANAIGDKMLRVPRRQWNDTDVAYYYYADGLASVYVGDRLLYSAPHDNDMDVVNPIGVQDFFSESTWLERQSRGCADTVCVPNGISCAIPHPRDQDSYDFKARLLLERAGDQWLGRIKVKASGGWSGEPVLPEYTGDTRWYIGLLRLVHLPFFVADEESAGVDLQTVLRTGARPEPPPPPPPNPEIDYASEFGYLRQIRVLASKVPALSWDGWQTPGDTGAALLEAHNVLRAQYTRDPLVWSGCLATAARRHAEWMAETGTISHVGEGGLEPQDRADEAGYGGAAAENAAAGQTDVAMVMEQWIASPSHFPNMVDASFKDFGAWSVPGTGEFAPGLIWCVVFGNPDG
jgi:hypothetical protein